MQYHSIVLMIITLRSAAMTVRNDCSVTATLHHYVGGGSGLAQYRDSIVSWWSSTMWQTGVCGRSAGIQWCSGVESMTQRQCGKTRDDVDKMVLWDDWLMNCKSRCNMQIAANDLNRHVLKENNDRAFHYNAVNPLKPTVAIWVQL